MLTNIGVRYLVESSSIEMEAKRDQIHFRDETDEVVLGKGPRRT